MYVKGFRNFISRGNLIELAVAVVIGTAFTAVVTAIVADLITPLIAAIGGQSHFSGLSFKVHNSTFLIGALINALLSFLIIAAVVFFFVVRPLNKLMARMKPEPAVDRVVRPCPECLSDIPEEAHRCAFCTAEVGAA